MARNLAIWTVIGTYGWDTVCPAKEPLGLRIGAAG